MILHWSALENSPYCSLYYNNTISTTTVCHVLPFDIILLMFQIILGQVLHDNIRHFVLLEFQIMLSIIA